MENQEKIVSVASRDYIESMKWQAIEYLESGSLFSFEDDNIEAIKEEANKLFKCIDDREIPESISTLFLQSTYGKIIFRQYYITEVGFNVVTKEFARGLYNKVLKGKKCLEVMSGTGALAKALKECGADIIATDDFSGTTFYPLSDSLWTEVEKIDSLEAVKKYGKDIDFLLMSWIPNHTEIGYQTIKLLHGVNPNCKLIIIGEEGAITGSTATENFKANVKVIKWFSNHLDNENMSGEKFRHIQIMNSIIMGEKRETVFYKTWGTIFDEVYIAEYKEYIEGEDEDDEE